MNPMKRFLSIAAILLCAAASLHAQATGDIVDPLLKQPLQSSSVVEYELQHFLLKHVPPLVLPPNASQWTADEKTLRAHELSVIYHGWPQEWIDAAPKFEQVGVLQRKGYRIVKLRYEIVPGFESVALLYEPDHMSGKMPAILDVNGHGAGGKAVEQKQKRCINQARRGIIALSIEFINFAELDAPGNQHDNLGLIELAGKNGMGLFYLNMRRGLDYLYNDPNVDRARIGITGLSGGGWQTITLSSLDPRIGPAAPAAGFSTLTTGVEHPEYFDYEQNAADVRQTVDYAQMDAMRAPRPTLLIYNCYGRLLLPCRNRQTGSLFGHEAVLQPVRKTGESAVVYEPDSRHAQLRHRQPRELPTNFSIRSSTSMPPRKRMPIPMRKF